jgi:hypothetical protein
MLSPKLTAELDLKWELQKRNLRTKFPVLSDEDLAFDRTRRTEMLLNLQPKLAKTARELQSIMENFH